MMMIEDPTLFVCSATLRYVIQTLYEQKAWSAGPTKKQADENAVLVSFIMAHSYEYEYPENLLTRTDVPLFFRVRHSSSHVLSRGVIFRVCD
jgi:hypothetical protein